MYVHAHVRHIFVPMDKACMHVHMYIGHVCASHVMAYMGQACLNDYRADAPRKPAYTSGCEQQSRHHNEALQLCNTRVTVSYVLSKVTPLCMCSSHFLYVDTRTNLTVQTEHYFKSGSICLLYEC